MIKVLNLYAGIGGNRKLWPNDEIEVTAVEIEYNICKIYKQFFPNDTVVHGDAHEYLLENYDKFDFIWSSPPCPTHSRIRNIAGVGRGQNKPIYPDMSLWQEIIFLNQIYHSKGCDFNGKFVVENVPTYYRPLIRPQIIGRHYFWANFMIDKFEVKTRGHMLSNQELMKIKGFDIDNKKLLRNCVKSELGLHIFNCAFRTKQQTLEEQ